MRWSRLSFVGALICLVGASGCSRSSKPTTNPAPASSSFATRQPEPSTSDLSPDHASGDGGLGFYDDASSPSSLATAVDDAGCVRNLEEHAAKVALETSRVPIAAAIGREPQLFDLTDPKCASVTAIADVNADGTPDQDVSLCLPPGGHVWDHYLYFSKGGCLRYADHLVAAELNPLEKSSRGVKDLETIAANGCAGNDFTWIHWRWNGSHYRVADTATCNLCSDSLTPKPGPQANSHPYCKREIARRKAQQP